MEIPAAAAAHPAAPEKKKAEGRGESNK